MIVVPRPGADCTSKPAPEQADPLAHADEAERALAHAVGGEADAVVLDHDAHRAVAARDHDDAHGCACACLMMFVSASWTIR